MLFLCVQIDQTIVTHMLFHILFPSLVIPGIENRDKCSLVELWCIEFMLTHLSHNFQIFHVTLHSKNRCCTNSFSFLHITQKRLTTLNPLLDRLSRVTILLMSNLQPKCKALDIALLLHSSSNILTSSPPKLFLTLLYAELTI